MIRKDRLKKLLGSVLVIFVLISPFIASHFEFFEIYFNYIILPMAVLGLLMILIFWFSMILSPLYFNFEMRRFEREMRAHFVEYILLITTLIVLIGEVEVRGYAFPAFVISGVGYFMFLLNTCILEESNLKIFPSYLVTAIIAFSVSFVYIISIVFFPAFQNLNFMEWIAVLMFLFGFSLSLIPSGILKRYSKNPWGEMRNFYKKLFKIRKLYLGIIKIFFILLFLYLIIGLIKYILEL